jgi:hypothetical protein
VVKKPQSNEREILVPRIEPALSNVKSRIRNKGVQRNTDLLDRLVPTSLR